MSLRLFPEAFFHAGDSPALRRAAVRCLQAALRAADPQAALARAVTLQDHLLRVAGEAYDLNRVRRLFLLGGGKAAAAMAAALEHLLGPRVTGGVVSVKYGHTVPTSRVRVLQAGHPLPDAAGVAAAEEVLALAREAGPYDLVLVLISGGGSALLTAPAEGVTLEDKSAVTRLLLAAGAPIGELNAVRKHLSRIKGGHLARALAPARSVALILSDVLGNPLDVIASGPTVPDPTTFGQALEVLRRRNLMEAVPAAVREVLQRGAAGRLPETPKPGDPVFALTRAAIIGDIRQALEAAAEEARAQGFRPVLLSASIEGEARVVGAALGRMAREARAGRFGPPPVCLLQGGETTVTVRGQGRGGRNQEVALGAALEVAGMPGVLVLSAGTDGTDGPTDAAGAVADGTTLRRAEALGLDPHDALARNDAYPFFAALGDLLITGPTLTNVNDLMLVLVEDPHARSA
ncbi:MAG: glycerate kinase [Armatimonadota bacterium]|nr:glycerate kinase [Armatimonadota bacterium]MDR7426083.1 glycerate kinase [Armatimonadota bacterium]MDR7464425.1 glycerate kinase [Armatimonadota bacterium]MDR7469082.1 glycerate kinase [Armatimonadota bacterium]MDR7474284.1 glycerate kinase [Armatimonadota bacterium]